VLDILDHKLDIKGVVNPKCRTQGIETSIRSYRSNEDDTLPSSKQKRYCNTPAKANMVYVAINPKWFVTHPSKKEHFVFLLRIHGGACNFPIAALPLRLKDSI
jgi:hypothetical protein